MAFYALSFVTATHFPYNFVVNELFGIIILSHQSRLFPYHFVAGKQMRFL